MPIYITRSLRYVAILLIVSATGITQQGSSSTEPGGPAPATQTPAGATQQAAQTLRVSTRLVLVDVVALDHKGQPIVDLTADDFTLREEGSEQKLRVFSFQQPGASEGNSVATKAEPVKLPPNMFTNVPTYKADRTLSVILLDGLNVDLASQKYVRQEMIKFLAKLPAGEPVAVYGMGLKLRLLQDFTTDPSLLKQAVQSSKGHGSQVLDNTATGQASPYLSGAASAALSEMGLQTMLNQIALYQQENIAAQTDLRVSLTMNALKALARTLAGYPGRKNLIWVTASFPAQIFATLSVSTNTDKLRAARC